jgi:hypothetical protein
MARTLSYRATWHHPADEVYATMVDPDYLRARLEQMGGPGARLLEHEAAAERARYRVRHGLSGADLPPFVATFLAGDIVIERTETLRREEEGHYSGDVSVLIRGTPAPAKAAGGMRLGDLPAGGSEFQVQAEVTVEVPILGGKIETLVAEQVEKLLAAETAFTVDWLARAR